MELIAAAVAFYAIVVPVFLFLEVAAPHPDPVPRPFLASAEQAAATWLAEHPLKPAPDVANDALERLAA